MALAFILLFTGSCGRALEAPRILVPDVVARRPERALFTASRSHTLVSGCRVALVLSSPLGVLHAVSVAPSNDPGHLALESLGVWTSWVLGEDRVHLRNTNPFRRTDEAWLKAKLALAPGARIELETEDGPPAAPNALIRDDRRCEFSVGIVDTAYEPSLVVLPSVLAREDGTLNLQGVVSDDLGRPTDIWTVNPERELFSPIDDWSPETLVRKGLTPSGQGIAGDPLRLQRASVRAPRHSAATRIRWYPDRDRPAEIWGETDGIAEGLYVALDTYGEPLVTGEHAMGVRHGLWFYFGHERGRITLQAMEDYVLGEVIARWDRTPGTDPMRDPASGGAR